MFDVWRTCVCMSMCNMCETLNLGHTQHVFMRINITNISYNKNGHQKPKPWPAASARPPGWDPLRRAVQSVWIEESLGSDLAWKPLTDPACVDPVLAAQFASLRANSSAAHILFPQNNSSVLPNRQQKGWKHRGTIVFKNRKRLVVNNPHNFRTATWCHKVRAKRKLVWTRQIKNTSKQNAGFCTACRKAKRFTIFSSQGRCASVKNRDAKGHI